MEWIDVNDDIPKIEDDMTHMSGVVVVWIVDGQYQYREDAQYDHTEEKWVPYDLEKDEWTDFYGKVTHWMRIVKPE